MTEIYLQCVYCFLVSCRTSPTWNILLYNAIGGSGDELYGTEPASYYAKNLLLNMGVAWGLVLLSPLVFVVSAVLRVGRGYKSTDALLRGAVLYLQALLWLGVLFSRPHKVRLFLSFFLNFLFIMTAMVDPPCRRSASFTPSTPCWPSLRGRRWTRSCESSRAYVPAAPLHPTMRLHRNSV